MPRLYLVRHARSAASWGEDPDPGLDDTGLAQALATAEELTRSLSRLPVYSSPMRRCRETAQPLTQMWFCETKPMASVAEIPSPPIPFSARRDWLIASMRGTWQQLHENAPAGSIDYLRWRRELVASLLAVKHDCVIYTHFVAINAAVGAARNIDDVVCFRPDHASVTVMSNDKGRLRVIDLGREADTLVLTRS